MNKTMFRKLACMILMLMLLTVSASAMHISHNITALNAHRNLINNNSMLTKNLETLSSGYWISRAGDDAAGLAFREKIRSQIIGLTAAQKNAQDHISLIQTAEGALTEVHSMLNRMVELATQGGYPLLNEDMFVSKLDDFSLATGYPGSEGGGMALFVSRTSAGYDFDQFAFDATDAGYGSNNPRSILVGPKGDLGLVSPGKAYVIEFDSNGYVTNTWFIATDGENILEPSGDEPSSLVWSSSNESVAMVDPETGEVTAVGPGTATITAMRDGQTDSVEITVQRPFVIPLEWELSNDGVKAIENKQIPANSIVTVRWPVQEANGGDEKTLTQYYHVTDVGWMTIEQMQEYFGNDFGDWVYTTYESKWE